MSKLDRYMVILIAICLGWTNLMQDFEINKLKEQIQQMTFVDDHSETNLQEIVK